ncbi:replication factor C subunit 3-like [Solanum dulcamara]|uniref:replication factor C subunit 3-like n=1 Tax=Solanum dulcamara TaxID=45834 RepID=UPI0024860BC2|nr:replication factor C subunit 3-like [Solanum dulcamara]
MSNNPSIPRSKSVPCRISKTQDVRSTNSADSLKPSWHKKIDEKRNGSSSSMNSRSTNNLDEFNKRNVIQEEKRYSARSPYYKGLTDSSKLINRQKSLAEFSTTPGKDSNLLASSTSYTSKSNFVIKVQEWSASYFVRKSKEERASPSSSETKAIRTTIGEELGIHSKGVRRSVRKTKSRISQLDQGKPLRERASEMQTNDNILVLLPSPTQPLTSPEKLSLPLPSPPPTPLILQTSSRDEEIESVVVPLPASPTQNVDDEKDTIKEKDKTVFDKRFTWADKYRPNDLRDFLCNRNTALELKTLAEIDGGNRHFIFAGQPGVGKRTMILALLREIYGHDKVQAREKHKVFHLKGEAVPSIQVNVKESKKHVEINLSETKGYEKHVIVELIKERKHKSSSRSAPLNPDNCKAIILGEADKLSTDALLYIKWMIERYEGCYKVFFCCSDSTKLQPIKSICKVVHLQKPSDDEIVDVLKFIAQQEGIELPHQMAARIASNSKSNLRQAIRSFEATWHFNTSLTENQQIKTGWEDDIAKIAKNIIEEQSPRQLYDIRGKLQNLIEHNVSAEFIFNTVFEELKSNLDDQFHKEMDTLKMKYNINSNDLEQGKSDNDAVKKIVHKFMKIEEFTAKFMSWYKIFVLKKGNNNPILSKGGI